MKATTTKKATKKTRNLKTGMYSTTILYTKELKAVIKHGEHYQA